MSSEREDDQARFCCQEQDCTNMDCEHKTTNRPNKMKAGLITRLNRIEGQIRGIKGMIDKDVYCDDILNQIAAAQAAMKSVSKLLLESHMKSCLVNRIQSGDDEVIDELLKTMDKLMK